MEGPESRTGGLEHNREGGEEHKVRVSSRRAEDKMRASRNSWRAGGKAGEQEGGQKSRREGRRAGSKTGEQEGGQGIRREGRRAVGRAGEQEEGQKSRKKDRRAEHSTRRAGGKKRDSMLERGKGG